MNKKKSINRNISVNDGTLRWYSLFHSFEAINELFLIVFFPRIILLFFILFFFLFLSSNFVQVILSAFFKFVIFGVGGKCFRNQDDHVTPLRKTLEFILRLIQAMRYSPGTLLYPFAFPLFKNFCQQKALIGKLMINFCWQNVNVNEHHLSWNVKQATNTKAFFLLVLSTHIFSSVA